MTSIDGSFRTIIEFIWRKRMGKSEMIKRAAKFILKGVPVINNTVYVNFLKKVTLNAAMIG